MLGWGTRRAGVGSWASTGKLPSKRLELARKPKPSTSCIATVTNGGAVLARQEATFAQAHGSGNIVWAAIYINKLILMQQIAPQLVSWAPRALGGS